MSTTTETPLPQGLRSLLGIALLAAALAVGAGLATELERAASLDLNGRNAPATLLEQAQQLPQERAGRRPYLYELRYDGHQRRFLSDEPLAPGQPLWVRYDPAAPLTADLYTAEPAGSALQYTGRPLMILWSALAALVAATLGLGLLRRPWREPAASRELMELQRRDARFGI